MMPKRPPVSASLVTSLSLSLFLTAGFHPPVAAARHRYGAAFFGAVAFGWIMYRMRIDGPVMFGLRPPPWEVDVAKERAQLEGSKHQ